MNVDLPVWTIRPNWKTGVLERLEWLTDVMTSDTGVEQRRSVRASPRRSFEITVNPTRRDRAYLDLALHRLGAAGWLFPLWHDQARLSDRALAGNRALAFDNTFREFQDGGYAIIYGDTFEWEVVQVAAQTADGITLTADLENDWSERAKVFPLRRARVTGTTTLAALTTRVGQSVLLFQLTEANDYPEMSGNAMVEYQGSPLLVQAPNRSTEITTDHVRLLDEVDEQVGLTYRVDTAGRAFAVQSHNWQVRGREAQADFRSFLYTLRGRQRMVWLPTYNEDVVLTRDSAPQRVTIENVGLRYIGGGSPMPGRTRLWTGSEVALIGALPAPPSASEEVLGLALPLAGSYEPGAAWSYLQAARCNQDSIELHHYADSDGIFECSAGFQTFAEGRDPSGNTYQPIPIAQQSGEPCGTPIGLNPCAPRTFSGWIWRIAYKISRTGPGTQPISLPNAGEPGGGIWTTEISDPTNSYWSFLSVVNESHPTAAQPGSRVLWTVQFGPGSSEGTNCYAQDPDGYCANQVLVQHWTMAQPVVVYNGRHFGIFPMDLPFTLPEV